MLIVEPGEDGRTAIPKTVTPTILKSFAIVPSSYGSSSTPISTLTDLELFAFVNISQNSEAYCFEITASTTPRK